MDVVYVTGMHRSGTSAVARVLNLLGLSVGDDESLLIPEAPDNSRGFWEIRDVVLLNDSILASRRSTWSDPPPAPIRADRGRRSKNWRDEMLRILNALGDGTRCFVLKDPRLSFTLPLWESVSPAQGVVVAIRDPRAVCQSLARRNNISPSHGARLWVNYTTAALSAAKDPMLVDYNDLLEDPIQTTHRLCHALGLGSPALSTVEAILGHLEPDLDHGDRADDAVWSTELEQATNMYQGLVRERRPAPFSDGLRPD